MYSSWYSFIILYILSQYFITKSWLYTQVNDSLFEYYSSNINLNDKIRYNFKVIVHEKDVLFRSKGQHILELYSKVLLTWMDGFFRDLLSIQPHNELLFIKFVNNTKNNICFGHDSSSWNNYS